MIRKTKTTLGKELVDECRKVWSVAKTLNRIHSFGQSAPEYICIGTHDWTWQRMKGGVYTPNDSIPIPQLLIEECEKHGEYTPDVVIINVYKGERSQLGWHVDRDEISKEKIVSISLLGDAQFDYCWNYQKERLVLLDGDVLIFGEEHRMLEHSVKSLSDKRINLTFRKI
jgi:alkylated DNA repair dioxygenase AlkB